jgi:hypothetical protein
MGAGTHGSLKGYKYQTTKDKLEIAVMTTIETNKNIERENLRDPQNFNYVTYDKAGKKDTVFDNYYNDGTNYLTLKIKTNKGQCEYTFRYYGGEEEWKTSSTSEIFICYAYDEQRRGGSEGNGGVDSDVLNHLTDVFEKELVKNIDKHLNLTHIDTE